MHEQSENIMPLATGHHVVVGGGVKKISKISGHFQEKYTGKNVF